MPSRIACLALVFLGFFLSLTPTLRADPGKVYLGSLHTHTASAGDDGEGDILQALQAARVEGYHFFGITPHDHMISDSAYQELRVACEAATEDGAFVALAGTEWGVISKGGHVGLFGARQLPGVDRADWDDMFADLVSDTDGAIGVLNHPKWARDFGGTPDAARDERIVLMEILGGPGHADTENLPNRSDLFHDEALMVWNQGWRCGVAFGEDDHTGSWGRVTRARMGVWAKALTRSALLEAFRRRRTFVVENPATRVWIEVDGTPMGAETTTTSRFLEVEIGGDPPPPLRTAVFLDADGPGGEPARTVSVLDGPSGRFSLPDRSPGAYVFVVTRDGEGDLAWSSPIWFGPATAYHPPHPGEDGTLYKADLNFSSRTGLMRVRGIGKGVSRLIDEAREAGMLFTSVEDLRNVEGLDPTVYDRIAPQVKITTPDETLAYMSRIDRRSRAFVLALDERERIRSKQDRARRFLARQILNRVRVGDDATAADLLARLANAPDLEAGAVKEVHRRLRFLVADAGDPGLAGRLDTLLR